MCWYYMKIPKNLLYQKLIPEIFFYRVRLTPKVPCKIRSFVSSSFFIHRYFLTRIRFALKNKIRRTQSNMYLKPNSSLLRWSAPRPSLSLFITHLSFTTNFLIFNKIKCISGVANDLKYIFLFVILLTGCLKILRFRKKRDFIIIN